MAFLMEANCVLCEVPTESVDATSLKG